MDTMNTEPITDAAIDELRRLHSAATTEQTTTAQCAYRRALLTHGDSILARIEAAEREREDLEAEVEELRSDSIEYEKDCKKALCGLATELDYEWDGDGATADELREFISGLLNECGAAKALAASPDEHTARIKAEALREAAKENQGVTDSIVWGEEELQGRQSIIDRLLEMANELEAPNDPR